MTHVQLIVFKQIERLNLRIAELESRDLSTAAKPMPHVTAAERPPDNPLSATNTAGD